MMFPGPTPPRNKKSSTFRNDPAYPVDKAKKELGPRYHGKYIVLFNAEDLKEPIVEPIYREWNLPELTTFTVTMAAKAPVDVTFELWGRNGGDASVLIDTVTVTGQESWFEQHTTQWHIFGIKVLSSSGPIESIAVTTAQ